MNEFTSNAKHGKLITVAVIGVVAVIAVTVAITWAVTRTNIPQETPQETAEGTAQPDPYTDSLTIIAGSDVIDGVAVGYPQNLIGVVSAAVEFTSQAISTLDPDRAATVGDVIASHETDHDFTIAPVNSRRALGAPTSGPVPDGYSLALAPVAYQSVTMTAGRAEILLLGYLNATRPGEPRSLHIGVYPVLMTWESGDWRWAPLDNGEDYTDITVEINTPEAPALGWITLTRLRHLFRNCLPTCIRS